MKSRPAVSLTEVLVAIFIMGIGIMSILALFPLGVANMAQAVKDERCGHSAACAFSSAKVLGPAGVDVRNDPALLGAGGPYEVGIGGASPVAPAAGPSYPVFIDHHGLYSGIGTSLGSRFGFGIRRVAMSGGAAIPNNRANLTRWFTLGDDLTFTDAGIATPVERQGHFTWAYMSRLVRMGTPANGADLTIVVYYRRYPKVESTYDAQFVAGSRSASLRRTGADPAFEIRKGNWVLDATVVEGGAAKPHGFFYRVENVTPTADPDTLDIELNRPALLGAGFGTGVGVVMPDVVEVFEKGTK